MSINKSGWIVTGAVIGACALAIGGTVFFAKSTRESADSEIFSKLRSANIPANAAELYPKPTVSAEQNAALLMLKIQDAGDKLGIDRIKFPGTNEEWEINDLRKAVEQKKVVIELAKQASTCAVWQPIRKGDGPNLLLPEFAAAKKACRALAERAKLRSLDGDAKGAIGDAAATLKLADLAGSDPIIIGGLVGVACHQMAFRAMADAAGPASKERASMDQLVELAERPLQRDFGRMFFGESMMSSYVATHPVDIQMLSAAGSDDPDGPSADSPTWTVMQAKG